MNQQVNVNLTLTLEVDTMVSKERIEAILSTELLQSTEDEQTETLLRCSAVKIAHIAEEAEIYGTNDSLKNLTPWDFVEKFYPNYSSCDDIAYNNDLSVILDDGTPEEGSCAMSVFKSLGEDIERVNEEYDGSCRTIYEKAIQSFIKAHPNLLR